MPILVPPSLSPFSDLTCPIGSFGNFAAAEAGRVRKDGRIVMGTVAAMPPTTGGPWLGLLPYERAKTVNWIVQTILRGSLFSGDTISISEEEEYLAVSGTGLTARPHSLCLRGVASMWREQLYSNLLSQMRLQVADIRSDIRFSIVPGDPLPNIRVNPHHPPNCPLFSSERMRARHNWQRVSHAVSCGMIPLLRGGTATQGASMLEQVEKVRRYTDWVKDTRVGLRCLASHRPTLFVFWDSGDEACVEYLREHIFNISDFTAYMEGEDEDAPHPWSQLVRRNLHVTDRTRLIVGPAPPPTDFRSAPIVFPTPPTAKAQARESVAEQVVLVCVDGSQSKGHQVLANLVRDAFSKVDGSRRGVAIMDLSRRLISSVWVGPEGLLSEACTVFDIRSVPTIIGAHRHGSAHIVTSVHTEIPPPPFDDVVEGCTWHCVPPTSRHEFFTRVGSTLADRSCDIPISVRGVLRISHGIGAVHTESSYIATTASKAVSGVVIRGTAFDRLLTCIGKDLQWLLRHVDHVDNKLVRLLSSRVILPLLNPPNPAIVASTIDSVDAIGDALRPYYTAECAHCDASLNLFDRIYFLCMQCHSDGSHCVVCERCRAGGRHYESHLLLKAAPWSKRGLLYDDFVAKVLRARSADPAEEPLTGQYAPLLWGSDNTTALPVVRGALLPSKANIHLGVYCQGCNEAICGVRWKCACCHDVDLCSSCEREWFASLMQGSLKSQPASPHQPTHVLFRVACAHTHSAHPFSNLTEVPL